jgi:hypothetical protein
MTTIQYLPGAFVKVQVDGVTVARAVGQVGKREWVTTGSHPVTFDSEATAVEAMKFRYISAVLGA